MPWKKLVHVIAIAACFSICLRFPAAHGEDIQSNLVEVSAHINATNSESRNSDLIVTVSLKPDVTIYAITQRGPGPNRTRIAVEPSDKYSIVGKPLASPEPEVVRHEEVWPGRDLKVHKGKVMWRMPVRFSKGVDPAEIEIFGTITMQVETADNAVIDHQVFRAVLANEDVQSR